MYSRIIIFLSVGSELSIYSTKTLRLPRNEQLLDYLLLLSGRSLNDRVVIVTFP